MSEPTGRQEPLDCLKEIAAEEYRLSTQGMSVGIGYAHTPDQLQKLQVEKEELLRQVNGAPTPPAPSAEASRSHGGWAGWSLLLVAVIVILAAAAVGTMLGS